MIDAIEERFSIRRFESRPVEREKLIKCVEAARLAPSAENVQPWRFIIIDDDDIKEAFGREVFSGIYRATRWAIKAPVIVVLLADLNFIAHRMAKLFTGIPYYLLDIGIAGEHFVLQAQDLGLGTCWIGWFDVKKAHRFFKLPKKIRVCELMAVGYPDPGMGLKRRKRKSIEEILFFNSWRY